MAPGCAGIAFTDTVSVRWVPLPQALFALTEIVPPEEPGVAEMLVVVEFPLQPEGSVQVYDAAPDTAEMEYVCTVPWQRLVAPVMFPGCAGSAVTPTDRVRVLLLPHALLA